MELEEKDLLQFFLFYFFCLRRIVQVQVKTNTS